MDILKTATLAQTSIFVVTGDVSSYTSRCVIMSEPAGGADSCDADEFVILTETAESAPRLSVPGPGGPAQLERALLECLGDGMEPASEVGPPAGAAADTMRAAGGGDSAAELAAVGAVSEGGATTGAVTAGGATAGTVSVEGATGGSRMETDAADDGGATAAGTGRQPGD